MSVAEKYIRLNEGLGGYGELFPLDKLSNSDFLKKATKKYKYKSLFWWPEEAKEYYNTNDGSMKSYDGAAFVDRLTFDFDSAGDLEKARVDIDALFARLTELGADPTKCCNIDFSGSKGFHVEVLLDRDISNEDLKPICIALAGHLPTFDTVIYDKNRKFRLRGSIHEKTGLYKTPLSIDEFYNLTLADIKLLAEKPRDFDFTPERFNYDLISSIKPIAAEKSVVVEEDFLDENIKGLSSVNFKQCPPYEPKCVHAMLKGVMITGKGKRNEIFVALINYLRNQNKNKQQIVDELKTVADLNHQLNPGTTKFTVEEIKTKVNWIFDNPRLDIIPGASGISSSNDVIKDHCKAFGTVHSCKLHSKTEVETKAVNISTVTDDFTRFAEDFEKNTVKTGLDIIDRNMKIVTGTTTLLIGASGAGKTSLSLDMMQKANAKGFSTMFFSMDMYKNLVFLKIAQKLTDYGQDQILEFFRNRDQEKIQEIRRLTDEHYGKTYFDFSKSLSLEEMGRRVQETENKINEPIKLVIVDYASRISGPYSDSHANATFNALKSVEIAESSNAAWIFATQISRAAGDGSTPLRSKRIAKDSGSWEETATNVITVWRPFMGKADKDTIMRIFLAKNRMGAELEKPLFWDGTKGRVWDMTDTEIEEYRRDIEPQELEIQKAKKTPGFF
jgi:KaiC/GvpD/RAD55 family RecA-like ATPase